MLIVDCMGDFYRNYFKLSKVIGEKSAGIYGMIRSIFSYKKIDKDIRLIWEGKSTLRKSIDSNYKANRTKREGNFYEQIQDARIFLSYFFKSYRVRNYESDDMCATIAIKRSKDGKKTIIATSDDDMHQVIDKNTQIYSPIKEIFYTYENRKYADLEPFQLLGLWSLEGDGSDNIVGVKRLMGKERIVKAYFPEIDVIMTDMNFEAAANEFINKMLENSERIINEKNLDKIKTNEKTIYNNMNLIRLREVPKEFYEKIVGEDSNVPKEIIKKYNMSSLYGLLEAINV